VAKICVRREAQACEERKRLTASETSRPPMAARRAQRNPRTGVKHRLRCSKRTFKFQSIVGELHVRKAHFYEAGHLSRRAGQVVGDVREPCAAWFKFAE